MADKEVRPKLLVMGVPHRVTYTNYRGETGNRVIVPINIWYGSTEFHPEPQWLLKALDKGKDQVRDFALKDLVPNWD